MHATGARAQEPRPAEEADERAPVLQWVGLLLAPATFFVHLQIGYVLVPWACARDGRLWIHLANGAAVILAAVGTYAASRAWVRAGHRDPGEDGGPMPRTRFLGVAGLCVSAFLVLLLLMQSVAGLVISPCQ